MIRAVAIIPGGVASGGLTTIQVFYFMNGNFNKKLLIIDDDPLLFPLVDTLLKKFLPQEKIQIEFADSGEMGIKKIKEFKPQLILCDIQMPGLDGFEVCRKIKANKIPISIILVSACAENEVNEYGQKARSVGADGFLSKPIKPNDLLFLVSFVYRTISLQENLQNKNKQLEDSVKALRELQEQTTALNLELQDEKKRLKEHLDEVVRLNKQLEAKNGQVHSLSETLSSHFQSIVISLSQVIELHQSEQRGHGERVEKISSFIAEKMGLPAHQITEIRAAAKLHELGIISLPPRGKKETEGNEPYRNHPLVGEMLLKQFPGFETVADIIRHLHENVDGTGIPDGLSGNLIPIGSRIVSVASNYDHIRLNKPEETPINILKILEQGQGTRYDEDVVSSLKDFVESNHYKGMETIECTVFGLQEGMELASDVVSQSGASLLRKGMILNRAAINNVLKFNNLDPITEKIKVKKA